MARHRARRASTTVAFVRPQADWLRALDGGHVATASIVAVADKPGVGGCPSGWNVRAIAETAINNCEHGSESVGYLKQDISNPCRQKAKAYTQ